MKHAVLHVTIMAAVVAAVNIRSCTVSGTPIDTIAKTIYGEARGEISEGRYAVASVIYNRSIKKYGKATPETMAKICKAPKQFSCWNNRHIKVKDPISWAICYDIAHKMVEGKFKPLGPWDHYYAYKRCNPSWARDLTIKKKIGNHMFGCCK